MSEPTLPELIDESRKLVERSKQHLAELRKSLEDSRKAMEERWRSAITATHRRGGGGLIITAKFVTGTVRDFRPRKLPEPRYAVSAPTYGCRPLPGCA